MLRAGYVDVALDSGTRPTTPALAGPPPPHGAGPVADDPPLAGMGGSHPHSSPWAAIARDRADLRELCCCPSPCTDHAGHGGLRRAGRGGSAGDLAVARRPGPAVRSALDRRLRPVPGATCSGSARSPGSRPKIAFTTDDFVAVQALVTAGLGVATAARAWRCGRRRNPGDAHGAGCAAPAATWSRSATARRRTRPPPRCCSTRSAPPSALRAGRNRCPARSPASVAALPEPVAAPVA